METMEETFVDDRFDNSVAMEDTTPAQNPLPLPVRRKSKFKKPGLSLKLALEPPEAAFEQSFEISDHGTFKAGGFELNASGMQRSGDERKIDRSQGAPVVNFKMQPEDLLPMGDLGQGAGGVVKKMLHTPTMSLVAVKSVDIFDKAKRHQLMQELAALQSADSPYLVNFLGGFYANGSTKLALEYCNRGSLQDVIDKCGPCDEGVLASVAKQALLGLQHLHQRHKVHRDIKPANILVDVNGAVKVSDFGILAELDNTNALCKTFVGTAVYMSPERIQSQKYSFPSDIWSLGMSLVTCALGKCALETENGYWGLVSTISEQEPPKLPKEFSVRCRSFVASCLQKDPNTRGRMKALLNHPFIRKVDPDVSANWPFPRKGGESELLDMEFMLGVMKDKFFPEGGYKRSMFDFARFQRIGQQLGFDPKDVQAKFEALLGA